MNFGFDVVNAGPFKAEMATKAAALSKAIDKATKATAVFIRAEATRNTPTMSSNLKKGWQGPLPIGKWAYEVRNEVEYAMYVEKGFMLTWEGIKAMAAKGVDLPKKGSGNLPRPIAGRHMLESAVHKGEPMHKAAILAAMKAIL